MKSIKLTSVLFLPLDFILLTFHWLKGCAWLIGMGIKEMFDLPVTANWPYGCATEKTESGQSACLPGRKYRIFQLFGLLCPDIAVDTCDGCHCSMKMYVDHDRWKPSWLRIVALGGVLMVLWGALGALAFHGLASVLPQDVKDIVKSVVTFDDAGEKSADLALFVSPEDRAKAQEFLDSGDAFFAANTISEAILEYSNAIQKDPQNALAYLGRAKCLYAMNHSNEALSAFEKAQKYDPTLISAHLHICRLAIKMGDVERALNHVEKALSIDPQSAEAHLIQAKCLHHKGQSSEARMLVEKALTLPIDRPELYIVAASFFSDLNENERAEKYYLQALAVDPLFVDAHTGLAYLLGTQGEFDAARERLSLVLETNKDDFKVRACQAELSVLEGEINTAISIYTEISLTDDESADIAAIRKAELLINKGDTDEGSELLRRIIDNNPQELRAHVILANMYLRFRLFSLAVDHASEVLKKNKKQIHARTIICKALMGQGRFKLAISELESLMVDSPVNLEMLMLISTAHHRLGDQVTAIDYCKRALASYPDSLIPLIKLGDFYRGNGDFAAAEVNYRIGLEKFPDNPIVANNLAMLLARENESIDEARGLIDALLVRFPDNPAILDTAGWVSYNSGDYKQAKTLLARSLDFNSNDPVTYFHLGKTLIKLNDFATAEKALTSAYILSKSKPFPSQVEIDELLVYVRQKNAASQSP